MSDIAKGYTYTSVSPGNQVTAGNLNALADGATILPGAIADRTQKTIVDPLDSLLILDAGDGTLKKANAQAVALNAPGLPAVLNRYLSWRTDNTINLAVDRAVLATSDYSRTVEIGHYNATLDINATGVGGYYSPAYPVLGTGLYAVWLLSDGAGTIGAMIQGYGGTTPLPGYLTPAQFPPGYTYAAFMGVVIYDAGTPAIRKFWQRGQKVYLDPYQVLNAAVAPMADTWQPTSDSGAVVPPFATAVRGFTGGNTSTTYLTIATDQGPVGVDHNETDNVIGSMGPVEAFSPFELPNGYGSQIVWKSANTVAAFSIWINGFDLQP